MSPCVLTHSRSQSEIVKPANPAPPEMGLNSALHLAEQERLVGAIAQRIRHTLDLHDLVTIAAHELGELLQVDRVEIVRYLADECLWRHLAEYRRDPQAPSFMERDISDRNNPLAERLKAFETVHIENVSLVSDEINRQFAEVSPGSWLLLPLKIGQSLWGSLSLVRHHQKAWQAPEVELIQSAAEQLMIAIGHSHLYQQVQQLNAELESTVRKRTAQLSQALASESMLKRITDKVRDSLDENHILETVVEELATLLSLDYCDTGLYDTSRSTCTIAYDHTTIFPSAQGRIIEMATSHPDIYDQLLSCSYVQFCVLANHAGPSMVGQTVLACPIFDHHGVLGDLWLFRPGEQIFDELEVRLVQQVTNQCAIAMRQARLYQAAQSQVEMLEHINHLKDDFLSTVSHELRTPISTIKMAIQMLTLALGREGLLPDPNKPSPNSTKIAHYLKILNDECNREIGLITDLLDLQQLEAGTHQLTVQPIKLSPYLKRLVRPFEEQAVNQAQRFEVNIASDLPVVLSDLQSLERILVELLTNACKYTPTQERIRLSAEMVVADETISQLGKESNSKARQLASSWVRISVTNFGIEISPDQLGQVFDKFYRIPTNDPHRHGGTGLGLALVKKLALRIGGRVSVASGNGHTCFTVELPVARN
ncbi:MAG: GAF domain-containing protein [Leptolyngbyaceae cyanobacterium bins.349]|nr:GAF domain-containing protein [Leptolyngbyaceae cyanobacterium bins.349]